MKQCQKCKGIRLARVTIGHATVVQCQSCKEIQDPTRTPEERTVIAAAESAAHALCATINANLDAGAARLAQLPREELERRGRELKAQRLAKEVAMSAAELAKK